MKLNTRHALPRSIFICCSLMLTLLIAACSTSGSGGGTNEVPTPTPTPTPAPALTTYTGEGYTVGYPKGWTSKQDTSPKQFADLAKQFPGVQVPTTTFTDSLGVNTVTIGVVPDPNGVVPPETALNTVIQASKSSVKNYKEATIAAQATVGGQSWNQAAATGDVTQQGVTANAKTVALVTNYPAKSPTTKLYVIVYAGPSLTFDSIDSTDFQPILKSFKFS